MPVVNVVVESGVENKSAEATSERVEEGRRAKRESGRRMMEESRVFGLDLVDCQATASRRRRRG